MNYRLASSIYLTMIHLGHNPSWALVWAISLTEYTIGENDLVYDILCKS
jgi:hypothetical protein